MHLLTHIKGKGHADVVCGGLSQLSCTATAKWRLLLLSKLSVYQKNLKPSLVQQFL